MLLADQANQYLDQEKPWVMIKDTTNERTGFRGLHYLHQFIF